MFNKFNWTQMKEKANDVVNVGRRKKDLKMSEIKFDISVEWTFAIYVERED